MEGIFEEIGANNSACIQAAEKQGNDMREAMRLLLSRREGRVFVCKTLQSTNDINHLRSVALMVMEYVEGTHA